MKIKCDYCGNTYEDTMKNCPSCGAPNTSQNKNDRKPRTIEELKGWYKARNLPPYETTRFFIGIDYKQPRAFGIYKDENGDFIVYKNKDTGERAIRYKGKDEAYAVNELYLKLKDEIVHQKNLNSNKRNNDRYYYKSQTNNSGIVIPTSYRHSRFISVKSILNVLIFIFVITAISVSLLGNDNKHTGYYNYNDTMYYVDYHNDWYYYDDYSDTWYNDNKYNPDIVAITKDYDSYYTTDKWDNTQQFSNVKDSSDYKTNQESYQSSSDDYDYDSDYDWSSGDSWDSGGTDWGSDW